MKPDERAKALLIYMSQLDPIPDVDATLATFASAIREAENAALERAYREVVTLALMADGNQSQDFLNGLTVAADRIKSMRGE